MARTSLTLAALATAAVPDLEVVAARMHSAGGPGDYDSAVLLASDGQQLIIRVPRSPAAEADQGTDLVALQALTPGIRSRLPFAVPAKLGQAPLDDTRAVVYDFLPGAPLPGDAIVGQLAYSVGASIAAIHQLPTAFVADAGLPVAAADEARLAAVALVDRAQATGRLPAALRDRWRAAAADGSLWQFQPTVVNGQLDAESFLFQDGLVAGLVGWSTLAVGDPARDLAWLVGGDPQAMHDAFTSYAETRQIAADRHLERRALLHAELELARWLLHGHDLHDEEIVADATVMLDNLVDRLHSAELDPLMTQTQPVLRVDEVERMLDVTPGAEPHGGHNPGLAPLEEEPSGSWSLGESEEGFTTGAFETGAFDADGPGASAESETAGHEGDGFSTRGLQDDDEGEIHRS